MVENLTLKNKLSMLWIFLSFATLAVDVLMIGDPSIITQIIAGHIGTEQITPVALLEMAVFLLIPWVMAFLSQTLKDSANRWTNIIVGAVFTGFELLGIMDVLVNNPSAYAALMQAVAIVAPALVVWYAYRWPKEEIQPLKAPTPVMKEVRA